MIRLSTRARYAARLMVELARVGDKTILRKQDLARRTGITADYAAQILIVLKHAGLVRSQRGLQGGFAVGRAPVRITVADVVEAVEGPIQLAPCLDGGRTCERTTACVTRPVWERAGRALRDVLAGMTLKTLADEARKCEKRGALTFEI